MAPEADDYGPPSWTAVAASWAFAAVFIPIAALWYPYDRIRAWMARRAGR